MIATACKHEKVQKNGTTSSGAIRYRCALCGKSWTDSTFALNGLRIGLDKAAQIVEMLCEGTSVSATARILKTSKRVVLDVLVLFGDRCEKFMAERIKGVFVGDVQVDEIWQFILCKNATAKALNMVGGCGDSYCFTAIDRQTKLLICWHMGRRTEPHTDQFIAKLEAATFGHFHISSDGWRSYPPIIKRRLGHRVDHGVMQKIYGRNTYEDQRRYSPARIIGSARTPMHGTPYQQEQICTSHVERMNGSIRCFCKRMARLTYCFSKKWTNHRAALGLFFAHYNFCRKHKTLKGLTPAMAHGIATHVWTVRELLDNVNAVVF
jgi:transposase-like protein/IS1 family transposase